MNELTGLMREWLEEEWKSFLFAVGHHLYREVKKRGVKHHIDQLYTAAKYHAGQRSMIFAPHAGTLKEHRKEDDLIRGARLLLFESLQNHQGTVLKPKEGAWVFWRRWMSYSALIKSHIHEGKVLQYARDISFKFEPSVPFGAESVSLAQAYIQDADDGRLTILADSLNDDGDEVGAAHLRCGAHTPVCPVIQRVIRRPR